MDTIIENGGKQMKNIKRLIGALLCVAMLAGSVMMAGCASNGKGSQTQQVTEDTEKQTYSEIDMELLEDEEQIDLNRVEVVRLITDVRQGTQLSAEHLITTVMDADKVPEGAITDYDSVIGKYAVTALPAGAYFYDYNISITEVEYIPEQVTPGEDEAREMGYLIITDYVDIDASDNLAPAINAVILANPNRTIFFPDGEYLISEPIMTPANPVNSVSLYLSNYAVIKASENWDSDEAMIRLGAAEPYNSITVNGSNYYMYGGIIDGSGIAKGVSIDSGRETSVRFVSIKHTTIGLHIKHGANGGSSDSDIDTVNIVGTNDIDSIGVLVEGYDNSISNMRIAGVQIGVKLIGGGNLLRNLHPLMTFGGMDFEYEDSIGFWDLNSCNFYDFCYSDNFATGFRFGSNCRSVFQTCFCFWYSSKGNMQVGFKSDGKFNAVITTTRVSVRSDCTNTAFLQVGESGGNGVIQYPLCNDNIIVDKTYKDYLDSKIIPY